MTTDNDTVDVPVRISKKDVGRLFLTRSEWNDPELQALIGTGIYDPDSASEADDMELPLGRNWKYAYWFMPHNYAGLLLARAWLAANGHACQLAVRDLLVPGVNRLGQILPPGFTDEGWILLADCDIDPD